MESGLPTGDPYFNQFVEKETQKQKFQFLVHELTEKCWDKCMDKPSTRLEGRTEKCFIGCVERFIDSSNFVANRLQASVNTHIFYENSSMFSRVRNFIDRHKGKFLITGGVIGGLYLLRYYAERKLLTWHDEETKRALEKQKRKQHYESTKQTAVATVLSMSSAISKTVSGEISDENLIKDIRDHPDKKHILWDQLKIVGFSRCISSIFTSALVTLIVHSHLMVLGAYTYGESKRNGSAEYEISSKLQHRYLENIQYFVVHGLPLLIKRIYKATSIVLKNVPLSQRLTLEQLEGLLKDIILVLSGDTLMDSEHNCNVSLKLGPWSQYVFKMENSHCSSERDELYKKMVLETSDILDSNDFHLLMNKEVNVGLNHVLDYFVHRYPAPNVPVVLNGMCNDAEECTEQINGECTTKTNGFDIHADQINGESLANSDCDETLMNGDIKENGNFENCTDESSKSYECIPSGNNLLSRSSLPVAKLIPILSGVIFPILSPAPGQLLQIGLRSDSIDKFSYNIYEAFSVLNV